MKTFARTILRPYLARSLAAALLAALLALLATASAQEYVYGDAFDYDAIRPYGGIDWSYEPYDNVDGGAIILSHSTPDDQHANFDVVGPNDYWEHFDFSDDPSAEFVLDDLMPGTYSIAATDDGLELAHTVVEVRLGEIVRVDVTLRAMPGVYQPGDFFARDYYGDYAGFEDSYPGYPYGAYGVGAYETYGVADLGALALSGVDTGVDVVVTGPNGYSEAFEHDALIEGLLPGVYAVAASGAGTDLAVTTIEIKAGNQLPLSPTLMAYTAATAEATGVNDATANEAAVPETTATPDVSPAIPATAVGMGMYQSWDADGDSFLTDEEFRAGAFGILSGDDQVIDVEEFGRVAVLGSSIGLDRDAAFGDFDANGNDFIDRTEFDQAYDSGAFTTWDANADNRIDVEEYHVGWFSTLDADGDSVVNESEYSPFENWFGHAWNEFQAGVQGLTQQDWLSAEF